MVQLDLFFAFARLEPSSRVRTVPAACIDEFLMFLAIAPLLSASFDRHFSDRLMISDASSDISFVKCSVEFVAVVIVWCIFFTVDFMYASLSFT